VTNRVQRLFNKWSRALNPEATGNGLDPCKKHDDCSTTLYVPLPIFFVAPVLAVVFSARRMGKQLKHSETGAVQVVVLKYFETLREIFEIVCHG
jgi:hypothetical protein